MYNPKIPIWGNNKFRGVSKVGGRYTAGAFKNNKRYYWGCYSSLRIAGWVYNSEILKLYKDPLLNDIILSEREKEELRNHKYKDKLNFILE